MSFAAPSGSLIHSPNSGVLACLALNDGNSLLTGAYDGSIKLWKLTSASSVSKSSASPSSVATNNNEFGTLVRTYKGHIGAVHCLAQVSPTSFVSASYDKTIRRWDVGLDACLVTISGVHSSGISCVITLAKSTSSLVERGLIGGGDALVASCSGGKTVKIWSLDINNSNNSNNSGGAKNVCVLQEDRVSTLCELADGTIACGSDDCTIKLWSLNFTNENSSSSSSSASTTGSSWSLLSALSSNISNISKAQVVASPKCVSALVGHTDRIRGIVEIESDNTQGNIRPRIASCSADMTIKLWDVRDARCIRTITGHSGHIRCMLKLNTLLLNNSAGGGTGGGEAGCLIATGGSDKTIRVWSINSGECVVRFETTSEVLSLAELKGSGDIVDGLLSGSIELWSHKIEPWHGASIRRKQELGISYCSSSSLLSLIC